MSNWCTRPSLQARTWHWRRCLDHGRCSVEPRSTTCTTPAYPVQQHSAQLPAAASFLTHSRHPHPRARAAQGARCSCVQAISQAQAANSTHGCRVRVQRVIVCVLLCVGGEWMTLCVWKSDSNHFHGKNCVSGETVSQQKYEAFFSCKCSSRSPKTLF